MFLALVASLGALWAGGAGWSAPAGADASAVAPESPGASISFGPAVTVQAAGGGEPTVAFDSEGRIFVVPIGRVYRSEDGGATFQRLPYASFFPGDSHIVIDGGNRLWVADLGGLTPPPYGSVTVWTSNDHGTSFTGVNPAASDTVGNDRHWLAAENDGVAYLLYRNCLPVVLGCLTFGSLLTRTTDGGVSWVPLTARFPYTSFPFVDGRDGALYVVMAAGANGNQVRVSVSEDRGASFREQVVANRRTPATNIFLNGAVDDAGNVYVTWVDEDAGGFQVWVSASLDRGLHWTRPVSVSSGVGTSVFPWVAAGGPERAVVAWLGTEAIGDPNAMPAGAAWRVHVAHSANPFAVAPTWISGPATPTMHVGSVCTGGLGCEADRDLLDFITVAVMRDGRAGIAFGEDGGGQQTRARFALQTGGPLLR